MAYKDPEQIERLVKRLYHPDFDFYIHVDKTFSMEPYEYLAEIPNVYFTQERYQMTWASYRFIEALTRFMRQLLDSDRNYDFISAFSGQDYPVKSTQEIHNYFENNLDYSFLSLEDQDSPWFKLCESRYKMYHMTYYNFRGRYLIQYMLQKILPTRKLPFFETIYGGPRATWWTLSSECANYVVRYLESHPKLVRFAKHSWAPDEFLIPTIIMNSPFKNKVILDSGRYIDWSEGGSNPKILTTKDQDKIIDSNKLFARKFDFSVDTKILDQLDARVQ